MFCNVQTSPRIHAFWLPREPLALLTWLGEEEKESLVFTASPAEQLADRRDGARSRIVCLLRGDSGEAHASGFFLPVMGPRAWEACSGSKWRVAGGIARV